MQHRPLLFCLAALLALSVGSTLRAQTNLIVGSNSTVSATNFSSGTNTYSNAVVGLQSGASNNRLNVTNTAFLSVPNNSSSLLVGSNGSGNILLISNTARVRSGTGYVGFASNSANNSAVVTGSGAAWTNLFHLYVGNAGTSNSLVISDGGRVRNQRGYLGFSNTSSGNSALVTGSGSAWTNSALLYVGDSGSSNSLVISNGGQVAANLQNAFTTSIGRNTNSANNSALVTGSNSLWTNTGDLHVGNLGNDNSMVVSDGGQVINVAGFVGSGAAASNNSALVTGSNSLWTNSGSVTVGHEGSGNSLTVADSGTVAATSIAIASSNGSSGTLNIGRFGTNDAAGTIITPTIAFGSGTGAINFNQSNSTTVSAAISGSGTINQLGSGTTTLSVSSSYTGATAVSGGQLVVDGSINNSTVTVNNGGTLAGSGSVGGIVINTGGTMNPGNSPGTQSVLGDVTWNGGGNYNWQVFDASGIKGGTNGWDWLNAGGSLNLGNLSVTNQFNINLWSLSGISPDTNGSAVFFTNMSNYTWTILTASNGITGFSADKFNINTAAFNGTGGFANALGGGTFSMGTNGNNLNLIFTAAGGAAVPEPGTWGAAALLVGGAAFLRWRKRRDAAQKEAA